MTTETTERACTSGTGWGGSCRTIGRPSKYLWCRPCLVADNEKLRKALEDIKENQGRVCSDFETCTHEGCTSSHASWAIAESALMALKGAQ